MRVYPQTYQNPKTGDTSVCRKWYLDFKYPTSSEKDRHRIPGLTDKRSTDVLGDHIENLMAKKRAGQEPDAALIAWLHTAPPNIIKTLADIDLIKRSWVAGGKPLKDHIQDFKQSLFKRSRKHVQQTLSRINRIFTGCHFNVWSDITTDRVERFLRNMRKNDQYFGAQTFNSHLQAVKHFCSWMIDNGRATNSPVHRLKLLSKKIIQQDARHPRRTLELEQILRLLEVTAKGPKRFGMDGYERYLLYRFAIETGFRANAIRSLSVASFDFEKSQVILRTAYNKSRHEVCQPLRPELIGLLKDFFKAKLPSDKAFGGTYKHLGRTSDMIKADLADAGIAYVDETRRYADFHSLKYDFATLLARSGVPDAIRQSLLDHKSSESTSHYTQIPNMERAAAIQLLPAL